MNKPRVLLVDDDNDLNEALCESLKQMEYEVSTASDSAEALTLFSNMHFDLVITDNDMRRQNEGLAFIRTIRETSKVPILLMTGGMISASDAKEAGADAFFPKPFDLKDLELFIVQTIVHRLAVG